MHIGVALPIIEFGVDLIGPRDFVQTAEGLGAARLSVGTGGGFRSPQEHVEALR